MTFFGRSWKIGAIAFGLVALAAVSALPNSVRGETCVAPNHPDCKVDCPRGCVVLYREKTQTCHTLCAGRKGVNKVDVQSSYMSATSLKRFLERHAK